MKVAIIGAGICGLYLAWKLSEQGEEVTVFEKREKIGKKACSGLFSERILDFIPQSQELIQNQIESCLIHWVGAGWGPRRTSKINFSGKFLVMNHYELDRLVATVAERAGAKILLNCNVTLPFLVTLAKDDSSKVEPWKFDRVIGCDGANSIVRKNLGLPEPTFRLAIQGFIPKNDFSNYVETWPTKNGFIWKIPRREKTEYGIIETPKRAKLLFEEFLKENNLKLERIKSALIPQGLIIPSLPKISLCGDAAGLTKPWSGGGVIWGLMAADLLLKNFPDFLKYKKAVEKFFSAKILFSKMATKMVYFLGFKIPWILPKNYKIEGDFLI